jgi:hypothetical protein
MDNESFIVDNGSLIMDNIRLMCTGNVKILRGPFFFFQKKGNLKRDALKKCDDNLRKP